MLIGESNAFGPMGDPNLDEDVAEDPSSFNQGAGAMAAEFVLRMFGTLTLESGDGRPTRFPTKRCALILARLSVAKDQRIGRDELAEFLWPDDFLDLTRLRLRQELRRLRQSTGHLGESIRADRQSVEIQPGVLTTDIAIFDELLLEALATEKASRRVDLLTRALALVQGPCLAGFQEPWVASLRLAYAEKVRRAWLGLADALQVENRAEDALAANINAVLHDPLDLDANTRLIRRLSEQGQAARARQAFRDFDSTLYRELGRHAPAAVRAILGADETEAPQHEASESPEPRSSVPRPLPLYGRDDLLTLLSQLLQRRGARVAVIGTVGVGKTHVVRELAWRFSKEHNLPVCFGKVGDRVLDGLMVMEPVAETTVLKDLIDAAAVNGWRVIAESRCRLLADGIAEVTVPPLPVPAQTDLPDTIFQNPSIRVLTSGSGILSSGARHQPNLPSALLSTSSIPSGLLPPGATELAELARRVGGLPAALKSFGVRLSVQSPEQLIRAFEDNLAAFVANVDQNGESIASALMRMLSGLTQHRRDAFQALSLLRGASSELAARLTGAHDAGEVWQSLEHRSLITVEEVSGSRRYRVPPPLAFAARTIPGVADRPEVDAATWHAIADWAFDQSRLMTGPKQESAFAAVEAELENLRRGIAWAVDNDPALAAFFVTTMWRTVSARGHTSADTDLLYRAAEVGAQLLPPDLGGEAWVGAGIAYSISGDLERAESAYLRAIRIFEAAGMTNLVGWANCNYGSSVLMQKDPLRAVVVTKIAIGQVEGEIDRTMALQCYAEALASVGQLDEAVQIAEGVFARRLQSADLTARARAYGDLALIYDLGGRTRQARPLAVEGVLRLRDLGIQDVLLDALLYLSRISSGEDSVGDLLEEADAIAKRIGSNKKLLAVSRARLGRASRHAGSGELLSAIDDVFRYTQKNLDPIELRRSLALLAEELDRSGRSEYANSIRIALGQSVDGPSQDAWTALLASDSHSTVCVLAVVMAKEALQN